MAYLMWRFCCWNTNGIYVLMPTSKVKLFMARHSQAILLLCALSGRCPMNFDRHAMIICFWSYYLEMYMKNKVKINFYIQQSEIHLQSVSSNDKCCSLIWLEGPVILSFIKLLNTMSHQGSAILLLTETSFQSIYYFAVYKAKTN